MLLWFLVVCVDKTLGITSKRLEECFFFFQVGETGTIFGTIAVILAIQDLILDKASPLRNL